MVDANNKKMNFFVRVYKSIFNFDVYTKFAEEHILKAIKYLVILVLIFSFVYAVIYTGLFRSKILEGANYLNVNVEDMSFNNGYLTYNNGQCAIYEGEKNIIPIVIVDTSESPNIEEYKDKVKLYNFGVILLRDKIISYLYADGTEEQFITNRYSDYGIDNISKDEIIGILNENGIYIYLAILLFIIKFIEYSIYMLLNAVVLAVLGQLLAMILRIRLKFGQAYKMGIYALTLPTILQLAYIIVNVTTGFVIQYFNWMYTTISYIYICVAILMIKADFINIQKELIRIKIEEQKIKEEQIDNEEETDEEKTDDSEENDDDKKTQNDDLHEQTDG